MKPEQEPKPQAKVLMRAIIAMYLTAVTAIAFINTVAHWHCWHGARPTCCDHCGVYRQ